MIRHFYHVWAEGAWAEPVTEHIAALREAEFSAPMTIGLVGPAADRHIARAAIGGRLAALRLPDVEWIEQGSGFEQVTLAAALRWVLMNPLGDAAVFYAHTKGAYRRTEGNAVWRRSMTRRLVGGWRDCLGRLAEGYETVGCHWLTPERDHRPPDHPVVTPFYGGNFWWARASYIGRSLPEPSVSSRFDAEKWIGLGDPVACDLLPGWPSMELCLEGSA